MVCVTGTTTDKTQTDSNIASMILTMTNLHLLP